MASLKILFGSLLSTDTSSPSKAMKESSKDVLRLGFPPSKSKTTASVFRGSQSLPGLGRWARKGSRSTSTKTVNRSLR
ncbi:MAG: hypothetical protein QXE79_00535 [Candidatus Bathyarchaeia archaeon]